MGRERVFRGKSWSVPYYFSSRDGTWDTARAASLITNFRVRDEVLTSLQERGSFGSIPLASLAPLIGPNAIALNVAAAALPDAAGRQITLRAIDADGQSMNWLQRNNIFSAKPVDLHGMDYVLRGMLIDPAKGTR